MKYISGKFHGIWKQFYVVFETQWNILEKE